MNKYFTTTAKLKALVLGRVQVKKEIKDLETAIEVIELSLIPPEGVWPGTNDSARRIAKEKAFAGSETLTTAKAQKQEKETSLALMDAEAECCHLDLQALEWGIRDQSNVALGGYSVFDGLDDNAPEIAKIGSGMAADDLTLEEQGLDLPEETIEELLKPDPAADPDPYEGIAPQPFSIRPGSNYDEVPF